MKLLSLSNNIPEHICDTVRFTQYSGERNISNYCGYVMDFISQVKNDNTIDGAVFPYTCDSCRTIKSYLSDCDKFIFQMNVPTENDNTAIEYFANIIKTYQNEIEKYYSKKFTNISERSVLINQRNKMLREIYKNLPEISYMDYLNFVHTLLKKPLEEQKVDYDFKSKPKCNKRVYLVGSTLSNIKLIEAIESSGMAIVEDNLPESQRLIFRDEVKVDGNIYYEIAKSILSTGLSPTQNNFRIILKDNIDKIKAKKTDGIIYISQKYCEPYDFLYSVYKKAADEIDVPILKITLTDTEDNSKIDMLTETFANML